MSSGPWKLHAMPPAAEQSILRLIDDGATMTAIKECLPAFRPGVIRWIAKKNGRAIKSRERDMVRVRAVAALVEMIGSQRKVARLIGCSDAAVSKDVARARTSLDES